MNNQKYKPVIISLLISIFLSALTLLLMYFIPWQSNSDCEITEDCIQEADIKLYGFPYPYRIISLASQFFFTVFIS